MIEALLGSTSKEQVLVFIYAREEGYAKEIADFWERSLFPIQRQLDNLEYARILVRKQYGRTNLYRFNPRYFLCEELQAVLKKTVEAYSDTLREKLLKNRRRPRIKGKPVVWMKDIAKAKAE